MVFQNTKKPSYQTHTSNPILQTKLSAWLLEKRLPLKLKFYISMLLLLLCCNFLRGMALHFSRCTPDMRELHQVLQGKLDDTKKKYEMEDAAKPQ